MANSILSKECCIPRQTWFGVHSGEDLAVAGLLRIYTIQIFWVHAISRLHLHNSCPTSSRYKPQRCNLSEEEALHAPEIETYGHVENPQPFSMQGRVNVGLATRCNQKATCECDIQ